MITIILTLRMILYVFRFFFFKQTTAYEMRISDWSSDVCSSDLFEPRPIFQRHPTSFAQRLSARPDAAGQRPEPLRRRGQRDPVRSGQIAVLPRRPDRKSVV